MTLASGNFKTANLDKKTEGLLRYVEKLTLNSTLASRQDVDWLEQLGWHRSEIVEAIYVTALFTVMNRA